MKAEDFSGKRRSIDQILVPLFVFVPGGWLIFCSIRRCLLERVDSSQRGSCLRLGSCIIYGVSVLWNFYRAGAYWGKTACFAVAVAVLAVVIAAECLLHDGRRSAEGIPST
jgi:hypothetical protein